MNENLTLMQALRLLFPTAAIGKIWEGHIRLFMVDNQPMSIGSAHLLAVSAGLM